ncbi:hypothetical protein BD779DRAFT_1521108 [Infundibulicybe gibba]|nr:hypothetical protein BD779DRAFT_1521108 [Infundibulicybe gibba]
MQKLVVSEGQWKVLAHAHKERIVLEAFYQASCAGPDMERWWKWCPEMALEYLTEKQRENFIHLLKQHTPEDLENISEPVYVGHQHSISFSKMRRIY